MITDMWFTKKEAFAHKPYSKSHWKYQGIAQELKYKRKNYILFRTNSKKHFDRFKKDKKFKIVKIY